MTASDVSTEGRVPLGTKLLLCAEFEESPSAPETASYELWLDCGCFPSLWLILAHGKPQ
jgi:hypothetical protein